MDYKEKVIALLDSKELSQKQKEKLKDIFPELAESDDEKIRKALIRYFTLSDEHAYNEACGVSYRDIVAWLEKQGERKPADKVEPNFKVGEWIIFDENPNSVYQVEKIQGLRYYLRHCLGGTLSVHLDNELIRPWNIGDAKAGDVLEFGDHGRLVVGIVSYVNKTTGKVDVNCLLENNNFKVGNYYNLDTIKPHPATKEQRDALMKAMADAGYTFDFEKKELRKLEPTDKIGRKFKVGDIVQYITDSTDRRKIKEIDTLCNMYHTDSLSIMFEAEDEWKVVVNAEDVEQESSWSEEDERMLGKCIDAASGYYSPEDKQSMKDWLKSLKERIQPQPRQKWSEKDKKLWVHDDDIFLDAAKMIVEDSRRKSYGGVHKKEIVPWFYSLKERLKSLKPHKYVYLYECIKECDGFKVGNIYKSDGEWVYGDNKKCAYDERFFRSQNTWKPSDEQITWLYRAADDASKDSRMKQVLNNLLSDLKKLREE